VNKSGRSLRNLVWVWVVVGAVLCASDVYAQSGFEQCLPAETIAYVSANDLASYRKSLEKTALYDIGQEPSVKRMIGYIRELVEEKVQQELGTTTEGLGEIFHGQVIVALAELDLDAEKFDAIFAADIVPAKVPRLKELLAAIEVKLRGSMPLGQPETVTHKGSEIAVYKVEDLTICHCLPTGRFVLTIGSSAVQTMQTFLDNLVRPPRASLARNAEFQRVFGKIGRGSHSFSYFNVDAFFDRMTATDDGEEAAKMIDTLGLASLKAAGVSSTIVGKGFKDVAYVHAPGERRGIMKLMTARTDIQNMLPYFPEDVAALYALSIDFPGLWQEFQRIMREIDPDEAEEVAKGIAEFEQQVELSVEKDIVGMFDGRIAIGTAGAPLPFPQVLLAAKLRNGAQPERVIGKLLAAAQQQPTETEYEGHRIFTMIIPGAPIAPSYTVHGDCLLFGISPPLLKSALSRLSTPSRSAADAPKVKEALGQVPKPGTAFSYSDTAVGFTTMYVSLMPFLQAQQHVIPINLAELPPAEDIAKHLFPAASSSMVDREGMTTTSYGPFGGASLLGAGPSGPAAAGIAAAIMLPALARSREAARRASCANNLKQMGLVCKMYASEHKGAFPTIDDRRDNLAPEGSQIYPEYLADLNILRCPSDPDAPAFEEPFTADDVDDRSYFYLGWVVKTEEEGLALLDAYEKLDLAKREEDIELGDGKVLRRLKEGVERFFITDINDPAASARLQSEIPVMWDRLGHHEPDGGNVLFMDGHVEFLRYPSKFPMTEKFMQRLEEVSSQRESE
jgi:prepilin-type processing-associated H-X9-DG protein